MSILSKSILYTLFIGLALNVAPINAMDRKESLEATDSSWFGPKGLLAFSAIAALAGYTLSVYAKYKQENLENQIKLSFKKIQDTVAKAIENLYSKQDLEVKNAGLFLAIKREDLLEVKRWVRAGANVNAVDERDIPVLVAACDNLPIFTYLISQPTLDINLMVDDGDETNSLFMLIFSDWEHKDEEALKQIVKLILAHPQLIIDLPNSLGKTALMYAAYYAPVSVVRLLLDKGANPNLSDVFEETPLMLAAGEADIKKVKLLLEFGANPQAVDMNDDSEDDEAGIAGQTVLEKIRNVFIPQEQAKLVGLRMGNLNRIQHLNKIKKYKEIYDYIYSYMLRDITSRKVWADKVEQELEPAIGDDNSWIVNQYLQNEDSTVDVG